MLREAKWRANRVIIEAEQYKATLEQPKGNADLYISDLCSDKAGDVSMKQMKNNIDANDEFFHLTCHVEPGVRDKIEKGEFIELDKLLPRNHVDLRNEGRVDLIHKDGLTFFRSHQNKNKINGIRKWEQAFRVYAAIYSAANPHRSAEIWQYVYMINTAAATYIWEDVVQYVFTFRQLMSVNPDHSWAKIYNQMWNLAMWNPLGMHRGGNNMHFQHWSSTSGGDHTGQNNQQRKPKYCWKFNKGVCNDGYCKFPHKCYYCHGRHRINSCVKKDKRNSNAGGNNGQGVGNQQHSPKK